jgi:hypothetical protein
MPRIRLSIKPQDSRTDPEGRGDEVVHAAEIVVSEPLRIRSHDGSGHFNNRFQPLARFSVVSVPPVLGYNAAVS